MTRVRFAPSPTGNLHIGSARTALFNWLYARHTKGEFLLRIEDTDKERSKSEFLDEILGSLKWLFMDWDGELVYQSKRFDIYKKEAEKLLQKGLCYREGEAIIFKVDKARKISFIDMIRGTIETPAKEIKDQVLIKSDGSPTYNFACVIDDAEMRVTHVIRGDDHIANTPKQVLLYEALGLAMPKFAHIPLILSKDGGRLSKRHGATAISEYRGLGFLPEAVVNYLTLMGWAPGGDREIIPLEETIKLFDVSDVNKTGAIFDFDKFSWINGQYIKNMDLEDLVKRSADFLKERGALASDLDHSRWAKIVAIYKERSRTLENFVDVYKIFFDKEIEYDEKALSSHIKKDGVKEILKRCKAVVDGLSGFDKVSIEEAYRKLADELKVKAASLIHPTRVAISGRSVGAGLFEMMELLGRETVSRRLGKFC